MTMKACVLENINKFIYKNIPKPNMGPNDVLLKVHACGICSSDLDRVLRTGAYHYPIVLGHEIAGSIVDVGSNVSPLYTGKRAVVFPLIPCKECSFCQKMHFQQCINYNYFGSRCDGGFAEYLAVPLWNLIFFDSLDYDVAVLAEPTAVALHALSLARLAKKSSLCIIGSGTIGILCGMIARLRGCSVTFFVRNKKKAEFLASLGFASISYANPLSESPKYDCCFECVGTNESINNSLELVSSRGKILFVGNPKSDMVLPQKLYWKILRSELKVQGVWNSSYPDDWAGALNVLNKIDTSMLVTHKFKLSDAMDALKTISNSQEFSIKGIFVND